MFLFFARDVVPSDTVSQRSRGAFLLYNFIIIIIFCKLLSAKLNRLRTRLSWFVSGFHVPRMKLKSIARPNAKDDSGATCRPQSSFFFLSKKSASIFRKAERFDALSKWTKTIFTTRSLIFVHRLLLFYLVIILALHPFYNSIQ